MEQLFSYGTLQTPAVQMTNFGRLLAGSVDALIGWRMEQVEITDPAVLAQSGQRYHPILRYTGNGADEIKGMVFTISPAELAQADAYEVSDYHRVRVRLQSGTAAWVYVARNQTSNL